MNNEIFEKVKEILVENLKVSASEITPDSELVNDLGINSLELADLVFSCEDTFEIEIDDKALGTFKTVADVVSYLEEVTNA
ncbi:MAG: acyl carrier protein [Clostridia bacterium]|jgi:acyl carrier protein|nr:acyl carrier protein [Clostridia bacterium]